MLNALKYCLSAEAVSVFVNLWVSTCMHFSHWYKYTAASYLFCKKYCLFSCTSLYVAYYVCERKQNDSKIHWLAPLSLYHTGWKQTLAYSILKLKRTIFKNHFTNKKERTKSPDLSRPKSFLLSQNVSV